MQEELLRKHFNDLEFAPSTVNTKLAGTRRIERDEKIDLDEEFERDRMESVVRRFQYSMEDFRAGKPNPTSIRIEPDKIYRDLAFYRSILQSYLRFKTSDNSDGETAVLESADDLVAEDLSQTFALERDMQSALRTNLSQLGAGLLLADNGNETQVEAGYIDILAKDSAGAYVVVELKAGVCRAPAVAQILAYMGCVKDKYGKEVKGVLVASDFEKRVQLASKAVPNLTLKRYGFKFEFSDL